MRRLVVISLVVFMVFAALVVFTNFRRSYQSVYLSVGPEVSGKLFDKWNGEKGLGNPENKPILEFRESYTGKLKKGDYVLETSNSSGYKDVASSFVVGDEPYSNSISLDYTDQKLNELLKKELPLITQVVRTEYPQTTQSFSLVGGKLFKDGTWYGARLVSLDQTQDSFRIVLNKKGGEWIVATKPPNLVLTTQDFPSVPRDVLESTNSL